MSDSYGVAEVFRCNRDGTPEFIRTEVQCNGESMSHADISFLLNEQAETIEVLREWVREKKIMVKMETRLAESETTVDKFKELANRRIAALEWE